MAKYWAVNTTTNTRLFGLIGFPLSHSFSPTFFAEKFAREGITDAEYSLFPLANISEFPRLLAENPSLVGLNVTIPHKVSVIPFLTSLSTEAAEVGAVNTVVIRGEKRVGYNTDVLGFETSLRRFIGNTSGLKALVLGTGGASMSVTFVLRKLKIPYHLVSRTDAHSLVYQQLIPEVLTQYRLIINTTPVGMLPDIAASPLLTYTGIGPKHFLFDLIYNPAETRFLQLGAALGARTCNGLEMLHCQAEHAWEIWQKQL